MRKTIKILCLLCLLSCTATPDQEEIKGFHQNGNLSYIYYLQDGKRNGLYKEYYPSGKIQIERKYLLDSIVAQKITDINGKVLVNYKKKNGRLYGLLGSSDCISVFPEEK